MEPDTLNSIELKVSKMITKNEKIAHRDSSELHRIIVGEPHLKHGYVL